MAPIHEAARTSDVEGIRLALFEDKVPPDLLREFRHRVYALLLRAGAALPTAYHENLGGFAEHKLLGGPYFVRIAEAGGFPAYERLQRGKLIATATKMLGHRLPPSIIPTVAKFWGHPGEYASRGHDPWNPGPVFY